MCRSAILVSFILIASAKIYNPPDITGNENYEEEKEFPDVVLKGDPIWVLELRADSKMELKIASPDEVEVFEENAGPMIRNYKRSQAMSISKNITRPRPQGKDEIEIVGMPDIYKLVNKFLLYTNVEPDSYITELHEVPSVMLYFQSPFALLSLNAGIKQWYYFISPPSSLPPWFYEVHSSGPVQAFGNIAIPEEVKQPFYAALMRLLRAVLSFPV